MIGTPLPEMLTKVRVEPIRFCVDADGDPLTSMSKLRDDDDEDRPVFEQTAPALQQIRVIGTVVPNSDSESLAERVLAGDEISIIPPDQVSSVLHYLIHYRDAQIDANNVDEAERSDILLYQVAQRRSDSADRSLRDGRGSHLSELLEAAQQRLSALETRYKSIHASLLTENEAHLTQLRDKHQHELEDFESSWQKPNKTRIYARASIQLIELRTRSVMLMKARRFDDHRVTERAASQLARDEVADRTRAMEHEFETQLKHVRERQAEELERQLMSNDSRVCAVRRARDREISGAKQRVVNLANEIKQLDESGRMRDAAKPDLPIVGGARIPSVMGLNMKEICQLKLPPLKVKVKLKVSRSVPASRNS
jgi:hypothetical protein